MNFTITQPIIEKTFVKLGSQIGDELDLSTQEAQVDFVKGFVESMEKSGSLSPSHAFGVLRFLAEEGYGKMVMSKEASDEDKIATAQELQETFDRINEKLAYWIMDPRGWAEPLVKAHGEAAGRAATQKAFDNIGGMATKAWDTLKSPEFLQKAAPWIIGGVGGYLVPKMLGMGGNGLVNAGLGAAAVGGGHMLAQKNKLYDLDTWKKWKDQLSSSLGGLMGGQANG